METSNGLRQERLANGLTVLMREMHHAPVASFWIWYRVGSRLEERPQTGLTHWVEHMLFRGTERFPGDAVHKLVARVGGSRNGFTSNDYTTYFETLPSEHFDLALQLESDRMLNARFTVEDVEAERTIILSERAGRENSASYRLREQLLSAAFPGRGYGHPIIGCEEDLKRITRDELWHHYKSFYGPDNAIVVAAGDFDPDVLLERVRQLFGPAAPSAVTHAGEASPSQEPGQQRRVQVSGQEPTAYVQVLFPSVEATHADFFPLLVLDTVLGGAKPMSFSGGGTRNRTSRLYRALVDRELAAGAGSSMRAMAEPFGFSIGATVRQGVDPQAVEDAIWAEVHRLEGEPVTEEELQRARKQTLAQFAYGSESVSSQGYWLGFSEVVASVDWFLDFPGQLAGVSLADVERVAAEYLQPDRATVGWYVPDGRVES